MLDTSLPLRQLGITIGALALWNALSYGPVHANRRVLDAEVALHLAVDIAALTSVLYFTGGPTNPFVSLYLVPISLAATSLPAAYAWLIGVLCGAGYSFLWWRSVPLPSVDFDLHLTGMWVNFVIAAVLIVSFVGRMARLVHQRDRELAAMRETALRDQQIIELGTLAAGTAHELNTPLSTLAILVEELDETATDPEQKKQLRVMMEEIKVINERLNRIAGGVGAERSAGARHVALRAFLDELMEQWSDAHPEIDLGVTFEARDDGARIVAEATIEQAIRNVLDNAAHATLANGGDRIEVVVNVRGTRLEIAVTRSRRRARPGRARRRRAQDRIDEGARPRNRPVVVARGAAALRRPPRAREPARGRRRGAHSSAARRAARRCPLTRIRNVLVVDDDERFAATLAHALGRRGWTARVAHDVAGALAAAHAERPDAAVVDLKLADEDGLTLLAPLRGAHAADADHRAHGLREHRDRSEGHQARRGRLSREAGHRECRGGRARPRRARRCGRRARPQPLEPMSPRRLEWEHIQRVLAENDGNVSATARTLHMHRRTLQRKLAKRPTQA